MSKEITVITQYETTDILRYQDDTDAEMVERMLGAVKAVCERNAAPSDRYGRRMLDMKYFIRDVPDEEKTNLDVVIGVVE